MVTVAAFAGVRFAPQLDPAACTAPPYDAIDEPMRRRLYQASPHNVVRLESPRSDGGAGYAAAGRTYRAWLADGTLRRDPGPTMTLYEQDYVHAGHRRRQRGVLCALALEPWGAGVLPHERVFREPVEDRLRLLRALPANVSPVFVVGDGDSRGWDGVLRGATRAPPGAVFDTGDGITHRTWVCDDPHLHTEIARLMGPVTVLMADGHHRYTTALEHRAETGGAPGTGHVLAYVVAGDGPVIRAVHRVVDHLPADLPRLLDSAGFDLLPSGPTTQDVLADLADVPTLAYGLVTDDGPSLLVARDDRGARGALLGAHTDVLAPVDVALLHSLLGDVLGVPAGPRHVLTTHDHRDATALVARGEADAAFLVRAPTLRQVRDVALAGVRLPPKSTSFHPKPRTGLVLRPVGQP